jgi:hypothetical protein
MKRRREIHALDAGIVKFIAAFELFFGPIFLPNFRVVFSAGFDIEVEEEMIVPTTGNEVVSTTGNEVRVCVRPTSWPHGNNIRIELRYSSYYGWEAIRGNCNLSELPGSDVLAPSYRDLRFGIAFSCRCSGPNGAYVFKSCSRVFADLVERLEAERQN